MQKTFVISIWILTFLLGNTLFAASLSQADSLPEPQLSDTVVRQSEKLQVYVFDIKEDIAPPVWRTTQKAFKAADEMKADLILIHMNTYGGMVDAADSIRTKILNSGIPVYVFIDNNAASAGALISIACDSIYMVPGASMGAATVVSQTGEVVPDKFQSYMRSMMRSTAEAKGRDPDIAQAMVDPSVFVAGVSDSGKVLTFTTSEAIRHNFCQAEAKTIEEVIARTTTEEYELIHHSLSGMDKVINFLIHPMVSGILIMLIVGGLYFELQTPGIGFPLGVAVFAALLYFAPLYLEGIATYWEIILFGFGIVLLLVEIFALPGFGVVGILGLIFIITGLSLAMVDTVSTGPFYVDVMPLLRAVFIVIIAAFLSLVLSLYASRKLLTTTTFGRLALDTVQDSAEGFTSAFSDYSMMIGKTGTAYSILRPAGKVMIDNDIFDATVTSGFVDEGEKVEVVGYQTGQLFVKRSEA
ncbi:MAG: NfeD family protein [Bacteroidales bacterium]|jgi:membrane-bound serine protease (ClpP class)|nr:nodulation protein NfeD [Bacteroidales bacterium]MCK9449421.1 nodulation protein NfeD [Bacteroidales bacterium]MDD3700383.1 NfeD family protein [Bacteroidales bacterium]MDY0368731.1 NfeD family protein [Bacteroidales bacterium]